MILLDELNTRNKFIWHLVKNMDGGIANTNKIYLRNVRITNFAKVCSNGKLWMVKLWINHFYFIIYDLPREQIVVKIIVKKKVIIALFIP